MFCLNCGALHMPKGRGTGGEINPSECEKCGQTDGVEESVKTEMGDVKISEIRSSDASADLSHLSKADDGISIARKFLKGVECPKCGKEMATSQLRQMDQSDEPQERFLICNSTGCGKVWRD